MKILVKKINGLVLPKQATNKDAAYDVVATTPPNVSGEYIKIHRPDEVKIYSRIAYIEYGTNLFIAPETEIEKRVSNATADASGALAGLIFEERETTYHTELFGRSSISKYNLVLANSVATIDNPYRGQIMIRFKYVFQPEDLLSFPKLAYTRIYREVNNEHIYQLGDKICQMKARPNIPIDFELVDNLDETQRGAGGFGSTGK
jgi:dUTPase